MVTITNSDGRMWMLEARAGRDKRDRMTVDLIGPNGERHIARFTLRSCFYLWAARRQFRHYTGGVVDPIAIDVIGLIELRGKTAC